MNSVVASIALFATVGYAQVPLNLVAELNRTFDYDRSVIFDVHESAIHYRTGVRIHDLTHASPARGP